MPQGEPTRQDAPPCHGEPARRRRTRRVRCDGCGDVLATRHPWDRVDCSCGALELSGPPWRPLVHWRATAGGGWHDVPAGRPRRDERAAADEAVRRVPIGYRPARPR